MKFVDNDSYYQWTVEDMVSELEKYPPETPIDVSDFGSYRGNYSDAQVEPYRSTVAVLLKGVADARITGYEGYKGGTFFPCDTTPVWVSDYSVVSGLMLVGFDVEDGVIIPVVYDSDAL